MLFFDILYERIKTYPDAIPLGQQAVLLFCPTHRQWVKIMFLFQIVCRCLRQEFRKGMDDADWHEYDKLVFLQRSVALVLTLQFLFQSFCAVNFYMSQWHCESHLWSVFQGCVEGKVTAQFVTTMLVRWLLVLVCRSWKISRRYVLRIYFIIYYIYIILYCIISLQTLARYVYVNIVCLPVTWL